MAHGKLVLIAGIPRSGSTWMFNVVRLLLQKQGQLTSGWIEDFDTTQLPQTTTLIKIHEFDNSLSQQADFIFTSRRHLVEIAASITRMGWTTHNLQTIQFLESILSQHQNWASLSHYEMDYQNMVNDHAAEIINIAATLGIAVDQEESQHIAKTISKLQHHGPAGTYNPDSLLHHNHVSDSTDSIPEALIQTIETKFKPWLHRYGYKTQSEPS